MVADARQWANNGGMGHATTTDDEREFLLTKLASSHGQHGAVLDALTRCFEALAAGDGTPTHEQRDLLEDGRRYLARSLPRHYADEEETFFPRVRRVVTKAAADLQVLIDEHVRHLALHAQIIKAIDEMLDGDRARVDACRATVEALHALTREAAAHIAKEDQLFGAWYRALPESELDAMAEEFRSRRGGGDGGGRNGSGRGGSGGRGRDR